MDEEPDVPVGGDGTSCWSFTWPLASPSKNAVVQPGHSDVCPYFFQRLSGDVQVVAVNWIFSFRIKCVGFEVIFGPPQWWTSEAVLDILDGHWEGFSVIRQSSKKKHYIFLKN